MNLRASFSILFGAVSVALLAGAAVASATVITNGEPGAYTGAVKAAAVGSVVLHGPAEVTCKKSILEAAIESDGSAVKAEGKVSSLTFGECGTADVTVEGGGSLAIAATSGGNGTLTSSSAKIKVQFTSLGITCVYATSGTDLGTVTGTNTTESSAALDISSAPITKTEGSFLCGSTGTWSGTYEVTTPSVMAVASEALEAGGVFVTVPKSVNTGGEGKSANVSIVSTGRAEVKNLEVEVLKANRNAYQATGTCVNQTLKNKGDTCTESVKCLTGAKGLPGTLYIASKDPVFLEQTGLECT